jgi:thiamine-phosphate pyrophosphorylase
MTETHTSKGYLILEAGPMAWWAEALDRLLDRELIACVLFASSPAHSWRPDELKRAVLVAQAAGIAALVDQDPTVALALGADGVHLPFEDDPDRAAGVFRSARQALGTGRIVGVAAKLSRHHAMVLAELGADYVAFSAGPVPVNSGELLETIAWWSETFIVPCVAWRLTDDRTAVAAVKAGAEFLAASCAEPSEVEGFRSIVRSTHRASEARP